MFENIGKKIMSLAKILCWICIVLCAIAGLILCMVAGNKYPTLLVYGLLLLFIGPLVALISSWLLYSWGQTVDNVDSIKKQVCLSTNDNNVANKETIDKKTKLQALYAQGLISFEEYKKALENKE